MDEERKKISHHRLAVIQDLQYHQRWLTNRKEMMKTAVMPKHIAHISSEIQRTQQRIDELINLGAALSKQLFG